uniref:Uncharacterized protein n=1 Tax=Rhizophora mucronata TaxID=61149 RepID=A0A2P2NQK0_RHIMU
MIILIDALDDTVTSSQTSNWRHKTRLKCTPQKILMSE